LGQLYCSKCKDWKAPEEFQSQQTRVETYTTYCNSCRSIARESMRLYHARRKRGIQVGRGRQSLDGILYPLKVVFTIPGELLPKFEAFARKEIDDFLLDCADHPQIELARKDYGVTSSAYQPSASSQQPPRPGANAKAPRPRNDDEQLFLEKRLLEIAGNTEAKNKWKWWDNLFLGWVEAGRPENYNHKTRKAEPREDASLPAQPGAD
jgi:hypothetical protein